MIQKELLDFLLNLEQNNNRDWFQGHKQKYDILIKDVLEFVEQWQDALSVKDSDIALNNPKKAIFRIYRDVRFSKNKLPYKTHIGAAISKGGRRSKWAIFYLHIQPGNKSFLGAGKWRPDSKELRVIRQEIDYNLDEFLEIVKARDLVSNFGDLDTSDSLKRAPKGYDVNHPAIDILRLKSLTFGKQYSDEEVVSESFLQKVIENSLILFPFVEFLNRAMEDID